MFENKERFGRRYKRVYYFACGILLLRSRWYWDWNCDSLRAALKLKHCCPKFLHLNFVLLLLLLFVCLLYLCSFVLYHACDFFKASLIFNPLNPELNPICYLLALLGAHNFLHVSGIRVKLLTFRRLMSYIYGAPILDVSRSHTTTQHSR